MSEQCNKVWHPADEPPDTDRYVLLLGKDPELYSGNFVTVAYWDCGWIRIDVSSSYCWEALFWIDLPELPEAL